ncbi:MAG: efflux RND transporter periplasmic adaptor subunit [Parcubacteria group bacterium]
MNMKKQRYVYLAIIMILIVGGYYWYKKTQTAGSQVQYKTQAVEKGTLINSVSASGNVVVDESATVDPDITGTVANLAVSVGDTVKKGQPLFTIINDQLGISASQAAATYKSAQASLVSAEAGIDSAEAAYKSAKKNSSSVHEDKTAAEQKIEAAKISAEASQQNLANALSSLNYARQQAAKRNVTSPIDGTVNEVNIKNGDDLSRVSGSGSNAQAPMIIGDMATLKTQVQVNEVDISNVKIGQKATLTFDALADFTATGTVEAMDSLGAVSSGVVTYDVTIGFDSIDAKIKPGMSVSAAITTSAKQDVIIVPSGAVKTQNGQSYVEVLQNGSPKQVKVQVGDANGTDTEIKNGVNVGEEVVTQTIKFGTSASTTSPSNTNKGFRMFGG